MRIGLASQIAWLTIGGAAAVWAQSAGGRGFYAGASADAGRTMEYEVQAGETLFHIAERFTGSPYRAEALARDNKIADPLRLKAGTRIRVPAPQAAMRYSIERLTAEGELAAFLLSSDSMSAGDRFLLRLTANADGYLYLFNRLRNGSARRIFPAGKKPVKIHAFSEYLLPAKSTFQLDHMTADEEIWVVLAAEPLTDLDAALDSGELSAAEMQKINPGSAAKGVIVAGTPDDGEPETEVQGQGNARLLVAYQVIIRRK